jgi:hypothetical protein
MVFCRFQFSIPESLNPSVPELLDTSPSWGVTGIKGIPFRGKIGPIAPFYFSDLAAGFLVITHRISIANIPPLALTPVAP